MGPLENSMNVRRPRRMVGQEILSYYGEEIRLIWQHLDAISSPTGAINAQVQNPHAEALRVAVGALDETHPIHLRSVCYSLLGGLC